MKEKEMIEFSGAVNHIQNIGYTPTQPELMNISKQQLRQMTLKRFNFRYSNYLESISFGFDGGRN